MLYYIRKFFIWFSVIFCKGTLSDKDIRRLLGYHIYIYPFSIKNLKPSSYNLTASNCAFVVDKIDDNDIQKLIVKDEMIIIPAGRTGIIETNESIYVSEWITGTYHSRVKLVNKGLGHIGTTLDPCFFGVSAIALHNTTDKDIKIGVNTPIATIMFSILKSKSTGKHDNKTGRVDKLQLDINRFYEFESYDYKDRKKNNANKGKKRKKNNAEKRAKEKFLNDLKLWRNQDWILNRDSLIDIVKTELKKENNIKNNISYSIIVIVISIVVIFVLGYYIDKNKGTTESEILKLVIPSIVPVAALIIGILNLKSKTKGE